MTPDAGRLVAERDCPHCDFAIKEPHHPRCPNYPEHVAACIADLKDDVARLHSEKMALWEAIHFPGGWKERAEKAEAELSRLSALAAELVDKGPWRAVWEQPDPTKIFIESDDFEHDVRLYVNGDFASLDDKMRYAIGIARRLNTLPSAPGSGGNPIQPTEKI